MHGPSASDNNGEWPGVAMTRLSGYTYYIDIPERFNNIFSAIMAAVKRLT